MENNNHVPSRLLSFITNRSPGDLTEESNLANEPSSPQPQASPRRAWRRVRNATLNMTRQQSVDALQSLADMGEVDRQRSIDRLPSIEQLKECPPLKPLPGVRMRELMKRFSHRGLVQKRFQSLRSYRLSRRLENATGSSPLSPNMVTTQLVQSKESNTSPDTAARPDNALRRMIGHDLPYGWQLAHEMMVNDKFAFNSDGLLLEDPVHRRFVHLFLRAADDKQQQELAAALVELSTTAEMSPELQAVVGKTLTQITDVLSSITDSAISHDSLSPAYICQMVSQQAYGPEQLVRLISFVCQQAAEASILEAPPITEWFSAVQAKVDTAVQEGRMLSFAAVLLHQLLAELKDLRTTEMNVRLALYRPSFQRVGAEFERSQVSKALENGSLQLTKTAPWLDAAWRTVTPGKISGAAMVATHREAVRGLLEGLALENKRAVSTKRLPETLALDTSRISDFRVEVRRLSVGSALQALASGILKSVGVNLNDDRQNSLQFDILEELTNATSSHSLCKAIATLIQVAAGDDYNKLPSEKHLIAGLKTASTKRDAGSLRALFTKRITTALLTDTEHPSLSSMHEQIEELKGRIDKLCSHWERAYGQLYVALLASAAQ
eukprot:TRINITY_DN992_c0_g1_i2.p1 TRINITY_DN992_c0_g1~~TRINITY_DN992_c0_g1_i2.p1  ORF type:complete len:610 (+),score=125.62 TRINITY_DN992_c0_g1_i2:197-2026(+)